MGSPRAGSNPARSVTFFHFHFQPSTSLSSMISMCLTNFYRCWIFGSVIKRSALFYFCAGARTYRACVNWQVCASPAERRHLQLTMLAAWVCVVLAALAAGDAQKGTPPTGKLTREDVLAAKNASIHGCRRLQSYRVRRPSLSPRLSPGDTGGKLLSFVSEMPGSPPPLPAPGVRLHCL